MGELQTSILFTECTACDDAPVDLVVPNQHPFGQVISAGGRQA
jgi:hypothetical protein